ncbi:hypothetical protein ACN47E_004324 [Coniothyrium glycines]
MSPILTTARLVCRDRESRDAVISAFRKIIAHTTPQEPKVLQYVCAVPVEDGLGTEIYMVEEYADQSAGDKHLATPPVQDLVKLFTTGDVLAGPPEVHNCLVSSKKTSGSVLRVDDKPAIVLVNTPYKTSVTKGVLAGWDGAVQDAFETAEGLRAVVVVDDKETQSVRAEYVFRNWEEWDNFAAKGNSHDEIAGKGPAEIVKIRAIDGFLGREGGSKL